MIHRNIEATGCRQQSSDFCFGALKNSFGLFIGTAVQVCSWLRCPECRECGRWVFVPPGPGRLVEVGEDAARAAETMCFTSFGRPVGCESDRFQFC